MCCCCTHTHTLQCSAAHLSSDQDRPIALSAICVCVCVCVNSISISHKNKLKVCDDDVLLMWRNTFGFCTPSPPSFMLNYNHVQEPGSSSILKQNANIIRVSLLFPLATAAIQLFQQTKFDYFRISPDHRNGGILRFFQQSYRPVLIWAQVCSRTLQCVCNNHTPPFHI